MHRTLCEVSQCPSQLLFLKVSSEFTALLLSGTAVIWPLLYPLAESPETIDSRTLE